MMKNKILNVFTSEKEENWSQLFKNSTGTIWSPLTIQQFRENPVFLSETEIKSFRIKTKRTTYAGLLHRLQPF